MRLRTNYELKISIMKKVLLFCLGVFFMFSAVAQKDKKIEEFPEEGFCYEELVIDKDTNGGLEVFIDNALCSRYDTLGQIVFSAVQQRYDDGRKISFDNGQMMVVSSKGQPIKSITVVDRKIYIRNRSEKGKMELVGVFRF